MSLQCRCVLSLLAVALAVWLVGCGDGASGADCVEGKTAECFCVGGGTGVQICEEGGNAWGPCQGCPGADSRGDVSAELLAAADAGGESTGGDGGAVPADLGPADAAPADSDRPGPDVPRQDGPCQPQCAGKECGDDGCGASCGDCPEGRVCSPEAVCQCEFAACGELCCPAGHACFLGACCQISCADKECGDDGCGGLCNGCLDIVYDDGTTETAYGYTSEPEHKPDKIACVVRFDLPQENMRLVQFAAGWMYGLYSLQIPFQLGYVTGKDMGCEPGTESTWYNEWCTFTPDEFVPIGDFVPLEPYKAMEEDQLGEVVFPAKTIYLVALFVIDQYPIYVCPVDQSGNGALAYMMSQHQSGQVSQIDGSSFDKKEANQGVIPFRIRVQEAGP